MSQLSATIDLDLDEGLSFSSTMLITPTGQPRRKVLFDFGTLPHASPRITLQLDVSDNMCLHLSDRAARQFSTPTVAPQVYSAGLPCLVQFEVFRVQGTDDTVQAYLLINGKKQPDLFAKGDWGQIILKTHSMGASLEGADPATFSVQEIVIAKGPLTEDEMFPLQAYLLAKIQGDQPDA